jgi:hypothetical protein
MLLFQENGKDGDSKLEGSKIGFPGEDSVDVSCPLCKDLLYQPAVLNCGHGKL